MKKVLNYILVFLGTFFFLEHYDIVYGDSCTSDGYTHNLVYDITELSANATRIKFTGYAFIDHYDNYGGKNATISVIASKSSTVGGINSSNSYTKSVTYSAVDLYGTRCTAGGCLNSLNKALYQKIASTGYGYANCNGNRNGALTSITGGINYGLDDDNNPWVGGTCVIHNVGFSASFSYEQLITNLNVQNDDQIYFYVRVKVKHEKNCDSVTRTSSIGVNSKACNVSGTQCSNSSYTLGKFNFAFQGLSSKATVVSYRSVPLNDSFQKIADNRNYFEKGKLFTIVDYKASQTLIKNSYGDNVSDHKVQIENISLYKLATYGTCTSHANGDGVNCSGDESGEYSSYVNSSYPYGAYLYKNQGSATQQSYYAYSSWMKVDGSVVLTGLSLREPPIKTDCSKISSWGSSSDINVDKTVSCNGSKSYSACINLSESSVTNNIYFQSAGVDSARCTTYGGTIVNSKCYLPVSVGASVSIYQAGSYSLGGVSPTSVKAGLSFNFSSSKYSNTISWINNKKWDSSTYYYLYGNATDYTCTTSGCSSTDTVISDSTQAYYKDLNGNVHTGTANYVSQFAIADAVKTKLKLNSYSNVLSKMYKSSDMNVNEFPGTWSLSSISPNVSKSKIATNKYSWQDVGNIADTEGNTFNLSKVSTEFTYSLIDGYLNVKTLEVKYPTGGSSLGEEYVLFGKRLYVPLKFNPDARYVINLLKEKGSSGGISLVEGINWGVKGTCNVEVEPGLYDCPGGNCNDNPGDDDCDPNTEICDNLSFSVKYRSINEKEPFPKATTVSDYPKNWETYASTNGLSVVNKLPRLNDVYTKYLGNPDYSYSGLFNFTDDGNYGSWNNINVSGSSNFVNSASGFTVKTVASTNFCKLGQFSTTCDKER